MTEALYKLGKTIKRLRENMELSQDEFAHRCGFDRTYISMIERGKRNISFNNLIKVAYGLDVSVSILTKGIGYGINTD